MHENEIPQLFTLTPNFSVSSRLDIPVCKNKKGTQLSSFL